MSKHRLNGEEDHQFRPPKLPKIDKEPPDIRISRNPYEVFVTLSFVFSSLSLAVFGPAPSSTISDLPAGVQSGIGVVVLIGAIATLMGIYWREPLMAAFIEGAGQLGVGGPILIYAINLLQNVHSLPGAFGAVSLIAITGAVSWRLWQICRWVLWQNRVRRRNEILTGLEERVDDEGVS